MELNSFEHLPRTVGEDLALWAFQSWANSTKLSPGVDAQIEQYSCFTRPHAPLVHLFSTAVQTADFYLSECFQRASVCAKLSRPSIGTSIEE